MIKKIESLPNFLDWPNNARSKVIDKFNELIEIINKQQEEIDELKRSQFNLDDRTSGLVVIGGKSKFKRPKGTDISIDVK